MKTCPKCGANNLDHAAYCCMCGVRVDIHSPAYGTELPALVPTISPFRGDRRPQTGDPLPEHAERVTSEGVVVSRHLAPHDALLVAPQLQGPPVVQRVFE